MDFRKSQRDEIQQNMINYWYGHREEHEYKIQDGVIVYLNHTESDTIKFTLSIADITEILETKDKKELPQTLSAIPIFKDLCASIQEVIRDTIDPKKTPVHLIQKNEVSPHSTQFVGEIDLKSKSQSSSFSN